MRTRTTAGAVVVIGIALLGGALALLTFLRSSLTEDARDALEVRGHEIAAQLDDDAASPRLGVEGDDDELVQVIDGGTVVAASPNVAGEPPVARLEPGASARIDVPFDDDDFLALAVASGPATVVVARDLDTVDESVALATRALLVGVPMLLLLIGALTWYVVGRALAPVEAIRRDVDEISGTALDRRVSQPPSDDEIARLAATMNRMLDRLEASQRRQRQFIADVSHELRSPVASIRQHAEVALAHPDRLPVRELAEVVLAEDLRVQRLVDDLLLLARVDERTLRLQQRPVDLDDLVLEEARRLRDTTELAVDTSAVTAARVDGDAAALRRVLRNLVDNAARHARGQIAFTVANGDGAVVCRVDDDGPGISVADRERVFERFVRLDDHRARDDGGSGLGLAIVAELVAAHGGTVVIGAAPGGGARFELRLPALDS